MRNDAISCSFDDVLELVIVVLFDTDILGLSVALCQGLLETTRGLSTSHSRITEAST
jgi:hypothetical protein